VLLAAERSNDALRASRLPEQVHRVHGCAATRSGGLRDMTDGFSGVFARGARVGRGLGSLLGGVDQVPRAQQALVTGAMALASITAIVAALLYGLPDGCCGIGCGHRQGEGRWRSSTATRCCSANPIGAACDTSAFGARDPAAVSRVIGGASGPRGPRTVWSGGASGAAG